MAQPTQAERFQVVREFAALREREGNYQEAAKLWNQAYKLAPNNQKGEQNKVWCENREAFCLRVYERPFGKE